MQLEPARLIEIPNRFFRRVIYSTTFADWSTMPGFDAAVDNSNVTDAQTWFTNEEMNALAPAARSVGGMFQLPAPLPPGNDFYVPWGSRSRERIKRA